MERYSFWDSLKNKEGHINCDIGSINIIKTKFREKINKSRRVTNGVYLPFLLTDFYLLN